MADWFSWICLLTLLLGARMVIAHEFRHVRRGYVLQTGLVALMYAWDSARTGDILMWLALAGLVVIRLYLIPRLLTRILARGTEPESTRRTLLNPSYALALCALLAALGIGIGAAAGGPDSLPLGFALATLLAGLAMMVIRHEAPFQILGILCADNGVDLLAGLTLTRIPAAGDYAVFIDVAVAASLLALLTLRLQTHGRDRVDEWNELRG